MGSTIAWLAAPASTLLTENHLMLFALTTSLVFGRMTTKIILASHKCVLIAANHVGSSHTPIISHVHRAASTACRGRASRSRRALATHRDAVGGAILYAGIRNICNCGICSLGAPRDRPDLRILAYPMLAHQAKDSVRARCRKEKARCQLGLRTSHALS